MMNKKLPFRIGSGYDVHRFESGRDLWLGGVRIPFERGLKGHSDADVLLHAICDAMLGALALRDIGYHFPDTSPDYLGADSKELLHKVKTLINENGYEVGNIDTTIVTEEPKINPHIPNIQRVIADILDINSTQVSVKASTNEKMGAIGKGEGIMALATVLLYSK